MRLVKWSYCFDPQALTSLTNSDTTGNINESSFDPQALTSLTGIASGNSAAAECFDPQALTSLTEEYRMGSILTPVSIHRLLRAWPKGYYLDKGSIAVSIHRLLRAWPPCPGPSACIHRSFDPQALTSLTFKNGEDKQDCNSFDPQALTSLTVMERQTEYGELVSIHRLLRAWPLAVSVLIGKVIVSIHRLLRAWPKGGYRMADNTMFRSTGSYEPDQFPLIENGLTKVLFRSTGSYEPDLGSKNLDIKGIRFDPQALTSLTGLNKI